MCGIFGIVCGSRASFTRADIERVLPPMFQLATKRGREASGLAVAAAGAVQVFKSVGAPKTMLSSDAYRQFISQFTSFSVVNDPGSSKTKTIEGKIAVIGHSRLVTNGGRGFAENNQPVVTENYAGIHNGIVVNDTELRKRFDLIDDSSDLDSKIIFDLINHYLPMTSTLPHAVAAAFADIEGEANIAFFSDVVEALTLATNSGSIYTASNLDAEVFIFASERSFLEKTLKNRSFDHIRCNFDITHLKQSQGLYVNLDTGLPTLFNLVSPQIRLSESSVGVEKFIDRHSDGKRLNIVPPSAHSKTIKRCTRCILPASFPLITFDENGVCNYCREHQPQLLHGADALSKIANDARSLDGTPDCIVMLSGGRDSSYGLHYVKKELGLNPVALTYDWGMVTSLARRNQSRMCGALGIEHIIRSPDIAKKRRNIRKNLDAWLKHPDLGVLVPLLTAGDKQFYHYPRQLRKEYGVKPVFFCTGSALERTVFKTAFCGIYGDQHGQVLWKFPWQHKLQLALYFARQFALNPRYFNSSLLDTIWAFFATYIERDDFIYLYHFIPWNEDEIMSVLRHEYDWEMADDTHSTWRIGDGTAAFYNYVFHTVAGFSEHDTFRSNQIRAGLISRQEALRLAAVENKPRFEAMREYASLVGFNLDEALMVINSIPKYYGQHI